jgi:DNA-binding IclR family transcriptional regulator
VVAKVALILDTFVEGGQATLVDVVRSTGLPMSTAHRLVSELAARHLLRRDDHGVYRPGALLHLLAGHGPAADLVGPADAVLGDVARATGGTARLGVLDGSDVEIVAERRWRYPTARPGPPARLPAHATAAGKAVLAFSRAAVVDRLLAGDLARLTPETITAPDVLRRCLARVRSTRTATSRGECRVGYDAVAVPVFGPGGVVVAAIELVVRDLGGNLPAMRAALGVAAGTLSRAVSLPAPPARPGGGRGIGDDGRHGAPDRAASGHRAGRSPDGPAVGATAARLPAGLHPRRPPPAGHQAVAGDARRPARRQPHPPARGVADAAGGRAGHRGA